MIIRKCSNILYLPQLIKFYLIKVMKISKKNKRGEIKLSVPLIEITFKIKITCTFGFNRNISYISWFKKNDCLHFQPLKIIIYIPKFQYH